MKPNAQIILAELVTKYPALIDQQLPVTRAVEMICQCHRNGGKLLLCGNGGSAADSEHIVAELMKSFLLPRRLPKADIARLAEIGCDGLAAKLQQGVAAVALTGHVSLSTAVLNDTDPYTAFAQQVYVLGKPGDVLIGISTSGNAKNVAAAAQVARAFGIATIGMTGERPCKLDEICDILIKAPGIEAFRVQEYHVPIYHAICRMVEDELFAPNPAEASVCITDQLASERP